MVFPGVISECLCITLVYGLLKKVFVEGNDILDLRHMYPMKLLHSNFSF